MLRSGLLHKWGRERRSDGCIAFVHAVSLAFAWVSNRCLKTVSSGDGESKAEGVVTSISCKSQIFR